MEDAVGWYLKQAGRIPLLTPSEEISLGNQVKQWQQIKDDPTPDKRVVRRGKKAYERMFTANLRLVVNISRKYVHSARHMSFLDLIQEGNIGLSRAVEKYDPSRGYKFSTYAYWWIKQACQRSLSQCDRTIRLPINAVDIQAKVRSFCDEYKKEYSKIPTVEECAAHVGVRVLTMRAYLLHLSRPTTLDQEASIRNNDPGNKTLLDLIPSYEPDPLERLEIQDPLDHLDEYLEELEQRDRQVLRLRYGLDTGGETLTYVEIGKILEVSKEIVRQVEKKALKKLQRRMLARADKTLAD